MDAKQAGIDRSRSVEDLHRLRLMALLDEQVRDKGSRRAAADLDVDHRTLTASLESGKLSRRMRTALNQALLAGAAGRRPTGAGRPWRTPAAPGNGRKSSGGSCGRYG